MRRRVFELLSQPHPEDRVARAAQLGLLVLIAGNVLASILATDAELARAAPEFFWWFEVISVAVFTVEYLLRIWSCVESPEYAHPVLGRLRMALSPMALIDLAAIAPFYVDLVLPGVVDLRYLRVLRLLRVFRLMRFGPVADAFGRLVRVVRSKQVELAVSMSFVLVMMVCAAGAMYAAEQDVPDTPFTSIPRAMWWSVVTITTIGYGDITPVTGIGRFIGGLVGVLGICAVALPVGIISSGYIDELGKSKETAPPAHRDPCPHCGRLVER